MRSWFAVAIALTVPSFAAGQEILKVPANWKVEVVAEYPTVKYCSVVCCAPDGRIFLAEDPMDQIGPPDRPSDRILCLQPDGKWTVFADKLYAVFGLQYIDGKLYVHHCPKLSVFDDAGTVGKNRVDLIECTNPKPWAGMNDHIPSGIRLGMDGWIYMSTGDKGIYGAVGRDGSKAEIHGGGIMRFRPDGTHLEVYSTGTRNHLEVAINAEDEKFTYDNTDDGLGWNTRFTHMVDSGYYGYPYDYKTRKPYTLWMMGDYGGGSPTGGVAYNEDALPEEYRGNLFMCEWGKGQLVRFVVERLGATYRVTQRDLIVSKIKGAKEFRPVGVTVTPDGMGFYIADWNYNGWSNRKGPAVGRLIKLTWTGKSLAAAKPDWFVPAAMGQPFKATSEDLVRALAHPAQSVRLVAMRRLADRGADVVPMLVKTLQDKTQPAWARWCAIWTLDRIPHPALAQAQEGGAGRAEIIAALEDGDPSVRRQAARQLGNRAAREAIPGLVKMMGDADLSVRFQAATALGRIGDVQGVASLLAALDETDLFGRFASFTALNRIGRNQPQAWPAIAAGLDSDKAAIREATLFAFRGAYDTGAVDALAAYTSSSQKSAASRRAALKVLAELDLQAPAWTGKWWNIKPAASPPPAHTVIWPGTARAQAAIKDALQSAEAVVRQGAAEAMVASNDSDLTMHLLNHVPKEKDPPTRRTMLGVLAGVKKPNADFIKAGNRLAAEVLSDSSMDAQFVVQALTFAVNLPTITPELTDALLKRASSDLPPKQLTTLLETLNKAKSADVTSALIVQLKHADPEVRSAVVRLLTRRSGTAAAEALILALQDKSVAVRKDAVAALEARKEKAAVPALLKSLAESEIRFDVINALAQTPDVRALAAYLEGMGGKNVGQRAACLKAVAALKNEALPAIEARLSEKPALPADVIAQLQKLYANDANAAKSRLFSIEVSTTALEEYAAAVVKLTGDANRGRKMFFDAKGAACSKCHSVQKVGGDVGPDLSSIGNKYNRVQLIDEVLYPSKNVLDGYESISVELTNGRVLIGIVRAETAEELTLVDAAGAKQVIKLADVESRKKTGKSVMPDGLQGGLTPANFADLISFLETLRDKAPDLPKTPKKTEPVFLSLTGLMQNQQPPGQAEGADKSTAVQQALARFSPLDFQALANHKRKDSFHSGTRPDNNLASLSAGEHRLLGIPFQIGDSILQVGSTRLKDKPAKIAGIKVGKKLSDLHFLHATAYFLEQEVPIGNYTVHYADGTSETIPIVNGKDVTDWWKYPFSKAPTTGKVAWEGANEGAKEFDATVWLFLTTWKNPKPNTVVTSIDFASTMDTECAPFCVAITGADPLKARISAKPLTAVDLDRLWAQLAGVGPSVSDAVEILAGAPAQAIAFLGPRIQSATPTADVKQIAALIAKLDDDGFVERETATKELQKLGLEALPQLRRAAVESKSAEVRQRAQDLSDKLKTVNLTADQKRLQAVLGALELIGSDEARKLLEEVASGKRGVWLGGEAEESLKRMRKN